MSHTWIAFLLQTILVTLAFAQGGTTDSAAFADAAQKALVQRYCEKDGRFMQCLGVDIRKDAARCAELVRSNWGFCRSTFLMTAPASIPQGDARSYSDNLASCLSDGAVAASGKSGAAVNTCVTGAR